MDKLELFEKAKNSIINANEEEGMNLVDFAQSKNLDILELLLDGFSAGNEAVGKSFDKGEISLPELIYAADVMKNITNYTLDLLGKSEEEKLQFQQKGIILIATVAGDIHDIGKGIVASTLKNAGYKVIDLGTEVSVDEIIGNAEKYGVDIIATSALLTSTMSEQRKLEQELQNRNLRGKYITMVGGAPCTSRWAKKIGASAYSEDARDAVEVINCLLKNCEDIDDK